MGQSTDALIAFGVDFGEDLEAFAHLEGFEDDPERFIEDALGIPEWRDDARPPSAEVEKLVQSYPVEVISHCSGDYPMYILAVPGTKKVANRGYPVKLEEHAAITLDQRSAFLAWFTKHDIELPDQPAWLLFSDWN